MRLKAQLFLQWMPAVFSSGCAACAQLVSALLASQLSSRASSSCSLKTLESVSNIRTLEPINSRTVERRPEANATLEPKFSRTVKRRPEANATRLSPESHETPKPTHVLAIPCAAQMPRSPRRPSGSAVNTALLEPRPGDHQDLPSHSPLLA